MLEDDKGEIDLRSNERPRRDLRVGPEDVGHVEVVNMAPRAPDAAAQAETVSTGKVIDLDVGLDLDVRTVEGTDVGPLMRPYVMGRRLQFAADVLAARRLQAEIFLDRGFIDADDVAMDGTIRAQLDPWVAQSDYFAVIRHGSTVATARQITLPDAGHLPALRLGGLQVEWLGGAGALGTPQARDYLALRIHPCRGGHRPDHRDRGFHVEPGRSSTQSLAGAV